MKSLFFSRVYLKKKGVPEEFRVEAARLHKSSTILKLKGIDSIDRALEFVGEDIYCPEEDLLPLEEGGYYFHQLQGCVVLTKNGEKVGLVQDLLPIEGNDVLIVRGEDREFLVPLSPVICVKIDVDQRTIIIDPPQGLLDLNEI